MKTTSRRKLTWSDALCFVTLSGLAFALASGCSKSEAAPRPGAGTESVAGPSKGAKADTDHYTAEIKARGPFKVGQQNSFEVSIQPKAGYHINAQYPYKFRAQDPAPDGVTYPKPLLARADGAFDEKHGTFYVPFVVNKAGTATLGGVLSLSVCSEANCIMEKQDLSVDVDVK